MFSDEDLRVLKADMANGNWPPQMLALVVRLEAAEKVCKAFAQFQGLDRIASLIAVWRESAGKEI